MNCQEFTTRVDESACGSLSFASLHESVLEHAGVCTRCAAWFETQQALTAGLQALANEERKIEAPLSLKSELLVAFENRDQHEPATVVLFPQRSRWARWVLAAAAAIVLAFVLLAVPWGRRTITSDTTATVTPAITSNPNAVQPGNAPNAPPVVTIDQPLQATVKDVRDSTSRQVGLRASRPGRKSSIRRTPGSINSNDVASEVASTEVKSQFVPLTYLNSATAMDGGIVVRVEIAREKLASLGLPFDLERADDVVKADIVLGDDGVARAIRLVQ